MSINTNKRKHHNISAHLSPHAPPITFSLCVLDLVPVLPDWRLEPAAVFAVTPRRSEQPAQVRHALQALQLHFAARGA